MLPVPHWPILLSPQAYTVPRSISKQIKSIDCFNKYNALLPLKWYAFLQYCQFAGYNAQTSIVSFILSATLLYLLLFHSSGTIVLGGGQNKTEKTCYIKNISHYLEIFLMIVELWILLSNWTQTLSGQCTTNRTGPSNFQTELSHITLNWTKPIHDRINIGYFLWIDNMTAAITKKIIPHIVKSNFKRLRVWCLKV